MKKFSVAVMAIVLIYFKTEAEIKNGFENRIIETRIVLENLTQRIYEDKNRRSKSIDKLTSLQKQEMNLRIDSLKLFILNYEITDKLIDQFRLIAPDLYKEIDTLKNAFGEKTDVYIKFLPDEKMIECQLGRTIIGVCSEDKNICFSDYGVRSVLIIIYSEINPLFVLAHEFGHVRYQVPYLATYFQYFKETYYGRSYEPYFIGHYPTDPSGKTAQMYERKFVQYFNIYKKNLKSNTKDIVKARSSM